MESFTAEVSENISSAVILMRPSFSQSDPERRAGLFIMMSLESTWNVSVSNVFTQEVNLPQWFEWLSITVRVKYVR